MRTARGLGVVICLGAGGLMGCGQGADDGGAIPSLGDGVPEQPQWETESATVEAQSTHLWIVNRAIDILSRHEGQANPLDDGTVAYVDMFTSDPCRSLWQQGLIDADFKAIYNGASHDLSPGASYTDILLAGATWASHFYDPYSGMNYKGQTSPTAMTEAIAHLNNALAYAKQGNWAIPNSYQCGSNPSGTGGCTTSACYEIGLSLHFMTDATQPMHAANFTAVSLPLGFHSDFEAYVLAIDGQFPCADWDASCDGRSLGYPTDDAAGILWRAAAYANPMSQDLLYARTVSCSDRDCCFSNSCWMTPGDRVYLGPKIGQALFAAQKSTAQYLWRFFKSLPDQLARPPAPTTLASGLQPFIATAADASNLYYATGDGKVWRQPLSGGTPSVIANQQPDVYYLAADPTAVYWTNYTSGTVMKAPFGAPSPQVLISGQNGPGTIRVDPTTQTVYWLNFGDGTVNAMSTGGGAPITVASQQHLNTGLYADASGVYWTASSADGATGYVMRSSLQGDVEQIYADGYAMPLSVTVHSGDVFWTDWARGTVSKAVKSANGWQSTLLADNQGTPLDLAVGSQGVYWANSSTGQIMTLLAGQQPIAIASQQSEPRGVVVTPAGVAWANDNYRQPGGSVAIINLPTGADSLDFGGAYGYINGGSAVSNPATGASTCPSGYQAIQVFGTGGTDLPMWYCSRAHEYGRDPVLDFGGAYGYVNGTYTNNPITNTWACPSGYTDELVLNSFRFDQPVHVCYKPHLPGTEPEYKFGGLFGYVNAAPVGDPLTGALACPASYTATQLLGTTNLDYGLYSCVRPGVPFDFGGAYGYINNGTPVNNPATGGLSCPSGYTPYQPFGSSGIDWSMSYCYRPHVVGRDPLYDFGGAYGFVDGGTPANNPLTGTTACPAGYTDEQVIGTNTLDYPAHVCYRPHQPGGPSLRFGGMFGESGYRSVPNPATATFSCPSGFTRQLILGTRGVDYQLYYCYQQG